MDRLSGISLGQEGVWDIKDTNAHEAGAGDYTGVRHFVGAVIIEDAVFNAATVRTKGGVVLTNATYPAASYVPGPFSTVQLDSGAVSLIAESF